MSNRIMVACKKCGKERSVVKYNVRDLCIKCVNVGRKHSEETNKKNSERNKGIGNGFYNKKHTEKTKTKIGKYERSDRQKEQAKQQLLKVGITNTKPIYDCWLKKYGKEEADKRLLKFKEKQSFNNKGEKNSMFGKPSPTGSGNGWSGWYKTFYFRSLLELSYLKFLFDNNIRFESAETKTYAIQYEVDGIRRNYFCDYHLIDSDSYVEVKPKALLNSRLNQIKFKYAIEKLGNKFIILTEFEIKKLTNDEIYDMYITKEIKWLDRYEQKFKERYITCRNY